MGRAELDAPPLPPPARRRFQLRATAPKSSAEVSAAANGEQDCETRVGLHVAWKESLPAAADLQLQRLSPACMRAPTARPVQCRQRSGDCSRREPSSSSSSGGGGGRGAASGPYSGLLQHAGRWGMLPDSLESQPLPSWAEQGEGCAHCAARSPAGAAQLLGRRPRIERACSCSAAPHLAQAYGLQEVDWSRSALSICVVGASGDLAKKKIFPALFALYIENMLPKVWWVVRWAVQGAAAAAAACGSTADPAPCTHHRPRTTRPRRTFGCTATRAAPWTTSSSAT